MFYHCNLTPEHTVYFHDTLSLKLIILLTLHNYIVSRYKVLKAIHSLEHNRYFCDFSGNFGVTAAFLGS